MKQYRIDVVLTEKCNLSCVYCYERNKSHRTATVETLQKLIATKLEEISEEVVVQIEFHGGEVLCAFYELKFICEWLWKSYPNRRYYVCLRTNGTLMRGVVANWFVQNKAKVRVALSFDGTAEMQDVNRNGSSGMVDIDFFRCYWPHENIKMTISPQTIGQISNGIKYLHSLGFPIICNLADGMKWDDNYLSTYSEQLECLSKWYLEKKDIIPASILTPPIERMGRRDRGQMFPHDCKWCEAGEANRVAYCIDGNEYPCVGFIPSVIGVKNKWKTIDFSEYENFADKKCYKCDLFMACATCCAQNFYYRKNVKLRDECLCSFRRVEIESAARLFGKMLQTPNSYAYLRMKSVQELSDLARGVLLVLKRLG